MVHVCGFLIAYWLQTDESERRNATVCGITDGD